MRVLHLSKTNIPVVMLPRPQLVETGREERQRQQNDEQHQNMRIGLPVDRGAFQRGFGGILHELRLVSRIDYDAMHPCSIPQHGASKQHLVQTEGDRFGVGLLEHPVELVEVAVGGLALQRGAEVRQRRAAVQPRRLQVRLPYLQIRLAVQV